MMIICLNSVSCWNWYVMCRPLILSTWESEVKWETCNYDWCVDFTQKTNLKSWKKKSWEMGEICKRQNLTKYQKIVHVLFSNFPQKLAIGLVRSEIKVFVLNGDWRNSSNRVPKTHIPWVKYNEARGVQDPINLLTLFNSMLK